MSEFSRQSARAFGVPHAFFNALFDQPWTGEQHVQGVMGYLMRQHAEADHPDQVDHIAELSTAKMTPADRQAWLFGYRFRDTPAPGGEEGGDGDSGGGGSIPRASDGEPGGS